MSPELHDQIKIYIREIVTVGFESGLMWEGMLQYPGTEVAGGLESFVDHCWTKVMAATTRPGGGHKMSLLIDVEMGRPIEVEVCQRPPRLIVRLTRRSHSVLMLAVKVIVGAVLKVARANDVPTPLLDFTYVLLKGLQVELLRQQKAKQETVSS